MRVGTFLWDHHVFDLSPTDKPSSRRFYYNVIFVILGLRIGLRLVRFLELSEV